MMKYVKSNVDYFIKNIMKQINHLPNLIYQVTGKIIYTYTLIWALIITL